MKFIEEQIEEIDRDIAAKIQEAGLDRQWQILQTVPGVQQRSAAKILAETGADITQFPSQRNLSSWAGICPGNNRSAGKNRSNRLTGGNPCLRGALTECAWAAAAKKNCFLKEKLTKSLPLSGVSALFRSCNNLLISAPQTSFPVGRIQTAKQAALIDKLKRTKQ
jgi:transposase